MTENSEEAILVSAKELEWVTCIQYPIAFLSGVTQDGSALDPVLALHDSGSKVNAMHPAFAEKLSFMVQTTNVNTQKIEGTTFETYGIVVAAFSVTDQTDRVRFFEKTFLVVNVSPDVVLGMLFLILNSTDVDYPKKELWLRLYTIKEVFLTIKQVKLVEKKSLQLQLLIRDIRPL